MDLAKHCQLCEHAKNVLSRNGMVVEVNIADSYFSGLLESKKNGIILKSKSSPFLAELTAGIQKQMWNN